MKPIYHKKNNEEIYKELSVRRYKKGYSKLNNTEKFVIEMDFDKLNY